ncbi:hypothetical protein NIES4074_47740 [Cylindrospermum sp. NIES-4074]|nr:hypothetical protein NIES4074_47740 [Cylindrospermum sp. NIES-4074]
MNSETLEQLTNVIQNESSENFTISEFIPFLCKAAPNFFDFLSISFFLCVLCGSSLMYGASSYRIGSSVVINNDGVLEDQCKQLNLQSPIDLNLSQLNGTGCCFDEFGRCVPCPSNS